MRISRSSTRSVATSPGERVHVDHRALGQPEPLVAAERAPCGGHAALAHGGQRRLLSSQVPVEDLLEVVEHADDQRRIAGVHGQRREAGQGVRRVAEVDVVLEEARDAGVGLLPGGQREQQPLLVHRLVEQLEAEVVDQAAELGDRPFAVAE